MKTTASNKGKGPELDLGEVYNFKCIKAEDAEPSQFDNDKTPRRVYTLQILDDDGRPLKDGEGEPITALHWVRFYSPMRPRSAVYGICSALLFNGDEIPEDEDVDDDELVGKRGRLLWEMKHDLNGKETGPGITKIMPPSKRQAAAAASRRGAVTEEDIDAA